MVKSILMIGGSRLQLPALRWAREAGLRIVLADRDPRAIGRTEAHAFEAINGAYSNDGVWPTLLRGQALSLAGKLPPLTRALWRHAAGL